jgi:lipopolysaccharide export system permease protein
MKILDRYLAAQVIKTTGLVVLVLLGIQSFLLLFNEIGLIGKNHYHLGLALLFVIMQMPTQLYQLFPMAGFLGCLLALGRLSSQSELVVMRASGMSILNISQSVLKAACFMLMTVVCIGEVLAPSCQREGWHMKARALNKEQDYKQLGGVWLKNQNQFIYMDAIKSNHDAGRVNTFKIQNNQLVQTQFSDQAQRNGNQWQMEGVKETNFGSILDSLELPQVSLDTKFDPHLLVLGQASMDQLSIFSLMKTIYYRERAKLETNQYRFVFWQRLFSPFVALMMILMGIPFAMSGPRSAGMGYRLMIGVLVGFGFYTLNQFLAPLAVVYQIPAAWVAAVPIVLSSLLCVMLVRRIS